MSSNASRLSLTSVPGVGTAAAAFAMITTIITTTTTGPPGASG